MRDGIKVIRIQLGGVGGLFIETALGVGEIQRAGGKLHAEHGCVVGHRGWGWRGCWARHGVGRWARLWGGRRSGLWLLGRGRRQRGNIVVVACVIVAVVAAVIRLRLIGLGRNVRRFILFMMIHYQT